MATRFRKSRGIVDISLLGDKQAQRALAQLRIGTQRKVVKRALRAGAKPVLRRVRAGAEKRTGAHAANIKLQTFKTKGFRNFGIQIVTGTREQLGIAPDDPFYYPAILEFGGEREDGTVIPAGGNIRRSMEEKRREATEIIAVEMRRGIIGLIGTGRR